MLEDFREILKEFTFIEWLIIVVIGGIIIAIGFIESPSHEMCKELRKNARTFQDSVAAVNACKSNTQTVYVR